MTVIEAQVYLVNGDTEVISAYLHSVLRTKLPVNAVTQDSDWFQIINLLVINRRMDAILSNNCLGFLYTCAYNQILDMYRKNDLDKKAVENLTYLVSGFDHYLNTKGFEEDCLEKIIRLTQHKIKQEPSGYHARYEHIADMILQGKDKTPLLEEISAATFNRGKSTVTNIIKESVAKVMEHIGT